MSTITFDRALQIICALPAQRPLNIVCNIDDVIWPTGPPAAQRAGIDVSLHQEYDLWHSNMLTHEQQAKMVEAFCDPELYRNTPYFNGYKDILLPEKYGAKMVFNSSSFNAGVAEVKRERFRRDIPGLRNEQLLLTVTGVDVGRKEIGSDTVVFIDDCPYHIFRSCACLNIVPRAPWNMTPKAESIMRDRAVLRVAYGDLERINAFLLQAAQLRQAQAT